MQSEEHRAAPWIVVLGYDSWLWVQDVLGSSLRQALTRGHLPCPVLRVTLTGWVHSCGKDEVQRSSSKMLLEERDVAEINPLHLYDLLPSLPPPSWLRG